MLETNPVLLPSLKLASTWVPSGRTSLPLFTLEEQRPPKRRKYQKTEEQKPINEGAKTTKKEKHQKMTRLCQGQGPSKARGKTLRNKSYSMEQKPENKDHDKEETPKKGTS